MGAFNTLLLPNDTSSRNKANRETPECKDIINLVDKTELYRTLHQFAKEYTLIKRRRTQINKVTDQKETSQQT